MWSGHPLNRTDMVRPEKIRLIRGQLTCCCALAQMVASGSGGLRFGAWGPLRVIIIVLQLLTGCAFVITLGSLSKRSSGSLLCSMPRAIHLRNCAACDLHAAWPRRQAVPPSLIRGFSGFRESALHSNERIRAQL